MAVKNCFGIPIEDLKTRMEDLESDEDFWSHESEDDTDSLGNKKSQADSGSEEEREEDVRPISNAGLAEPGVQLQNHLWYLPLSKTKFCSKKCIYILNCTLRF